MKTSNFNTTHIVREQPYYGTIFSRALSQVWEQSQETSLSHYFCLVTVLLSAESAHNSLTFVLQDISETSCERSDQLNGNASPIPGSSWGDVPHVHQTRNSQDTKNKEQEIFHIS